MYLKLKEEEDDNSAYYKQQFLAALVQSCTEVVGNQKMVYLQIIEFLAYCALHHQIKDSPDKVKDQGSMCKKKLSVVDMSILHGKSVGDFLTISDEAFILFMCWNNIIESSTVDGSAVFYSFAASSSEARFGNKRTKGSRKTSTLEEI